MYEKELQKTWQYIIQDAGIKYLFVRDPAIHDMVKSFQKDIPGLKEIFILYGEGENTLAALEETGKANPVPSYKPHWSETAFIIYTSGTTGDPKGVLLHHGAMTYRAGISRGFLFGRNNACALSIFPGRSLRPCCRSALLHPCGGSIGICRIRGKTDCQFSGSQTHTDYPPYPASSTRYTIRSSRVWPPIPSRNNFLTLPAPKP